MKLDGRAFGFAAAAVAAALWTVCAAGIAIAPHASIQFFSAITHLDLATLGRPVTWGNYVLGLISWSIAAGLAAGTAGTMYNRFLTAPDTVAGAPERAAQR